MAKYSDRLFWPSISNENRLTILTLLYEHNVLTPSEILKHLDITQPALSQHLNKLTIQNLISFRKDGKYRKFFLSELGKKIFEENVKADQTPCFCDCHEEGMDICPNCLDKHPEIATRYELKK